jgi:hypothetical protein
MKRYWPWLLIPLYWIALATLAAVLPHEDHPLLTPVPDSWKASGNFRDGRPPHGPPREIIYSSEVDNHYWIVDRYTGNGSGKLESVPFPAPTWISLLVMGDLTKPMNQVYFRLVDRDERFPIEAQGDLPWRRATHRLPSHWLGKPIQLAAVAGPRERYNGFGVGSPSSIGSGSLLALQLRTWTSLPAFLVGLGLFLLPGLPIALWTTRQEITAPYLLVPIAIVFSCVAGYLVFWAYFWNQSFGLIAGVAILFGSGIWTLIEMRRNLHGRSLLLSEDFVRPLRLMVLMGLFYLALLQSVELSVPYEVAPRLRFTEFILAVDNELPYRLADSLYNGQDPRPIVKGWKSSDRPPLQAALLLLQMPLLYRTNHPKDHGLVASIAMQCAWVPAVLALWQLCGLSRKRIGIALLFVTLSGFSLVNTVYTWPKMLAAALVLIAILLLLFDRGPKGTPFPWSKTLLAGMAMTLAALSHGGVAFTLVPIGLCLLIPRYYPGLARLLTMGVVVVAFQVPWMQYQKHYDPPGNRLLRQHLTADSPTWEDSNSLLVNLWNAYANLSVVEIVKNKIENSRVLVMASPELVRWPSASLTPAEWPTDSVGFRRCDFMCLFWSMGVLNLGWPIAIVAWRRRMTDFDGSAVALVLALGLAGVASWVLLMFGPGSTVIHQGSYATMLLLFAALSALLTTLPGKVPYILLAIQGAVFAMGWLVTSPANYFSVPNVFMIPLAVGFFVALIRATLYAETPAAYSPAAKSVAPVGVRPAKQIRKWVDDR